MLYPDAFVAVHSEPLEVTSSFRVPFQPVPPLLVTDHVFADDEGNRFAEDRATWEWELATPYHLRHDHRTGRLDIVRLADDRYASVTPNAAGRLPIPELELEVTLRDGWVRYWFRGELLPLPGDLWRERDAERSARLAAERRAADAESELARLRAELAKASPPS